MRTIQIFLNLINSIIANPSVLSLLPWEDIGLCLLMELEARGSLYTREHILQRNALFQELIAETRQYASLGNTEAVVSRLQQIVFTLQTMPEAEYANRLSEQANFDHACLNHYKNNTIIVLGDSHVNFFSGNEELSFLPIGRDINICADNTPYPFTPLHLGPCLVYSCNRYNTTSSFREKLEYLCQNFIKAKARILCCLGEIDIRVHVFKQAALQNRSYQDIVDDILTEYYVFLLRMQGLGYQVSCWGPIASQSETCPMDPRFPRNGTETERNMATAYFNQKLSLFCRQNDIPFLSIFNRLVTSDYLTLDRFYSPDHCHLGQAALPFALEEWQKIL